MNIYQKIMFNWINRNHQPQNPWNFYNLFKLFFLACIFFLSVGAFDSPSFFCANGAVIDPPTPISVVEVMTAGWSCPFSSFGANGDVEPGTALFWSALLTEEFVWSTFRILVDSEITPVLNFSFGLRACIPV